MTSTPAPQWPSLALFDEGWRRNPVPETLSVTLLEQFIPGGPPPFSVLHRLHIRWRQRLERYQAPVRRPP